jgi:hypothetical protein
LGGDFFLHGRGGFRAAATKRSQGQQEGEVAKAVRHGSSLMLEAWFRVAAFRISPCRVIAKQPLGGTLRLAAAHLAVW